MVGSRNTRIARHLRTKCPSGVVAGIALPAAAPHGLDLLDLHQRKSSSDVVVANGVLGDAADDAADDVTAGVGTDAPSAAAGAAAGVAAAAAAVAADTDVVVVVVAAAVPTWVPPLLQHPAQRQRSNLVKRMMMPGPTQTASVTMEAPVAALALTEEVRGGDRTDQLSEVG